MERPALRRIYYIYRVTEQGELPNVPRLARELEVNRRTVERDLEYMRDQLGAPLEYDYRRRGYFFTQPFSLPPVQFTEQDLLGILLAHRLLERYLATPYERSVRRAIEKICMLLPRAASVDNADIERLMSFEGQAFSEGEERVAALVAALTQAAEEGQSFDILYYTAGRDEAGWRRVDPYHLRRAGGAWYLIAFCHRRNEARTFAVHRIREWRASGGRFQRPRDFSIEAYLGLSWSLVRGQPHDVVIMFNAQAARYVREFLWHSTQRLEELPDGGLIWRGRVEGLAEVQQWVLRFGAEARVLEPPELRREMAAEAARMVEGYGEAATGGLAGEGVAPEGPGAVG